MRGFVVREREIAGLSELARPDIEIRDYVGGSFAADAVGQP